MCSAGVHQHLQYDGWQGPQDLRSGAVDPERRNRARILVLGISRRGPVRTLHAPRRKFSVCVEVSEVDRKLDGGPLGLPLSFSNDIPVSDKDENFHK